MLFLLAVLPIQGYAETGVEAPNLSIQTQTYFHDPESGTFLYRNAKVQWDNISVESTEIRYHPETHRLTAEGYVRVTEGELIAVMDELEISIKDGSGIFRNAIVYDASNKAYMTASEVRRVGEKHYVAQTCTFTTCNPKSPAWRIKGSEINYFDENFSSSRSTVLEVGGVPVFYFPYLAWPTVTRRQSGFLPPEYSITRSNRRKFDLGYRVGVPYFWAIDPEHDLTLTYDWVERRGPGLRLDYQYALTEGMRGEIKYQKFLERDPRDPKNESGSLNAGDIESSELHPERYKFQFNHNQQLDQRSRLIVSALVYSDSQFQKEYELVNKPDPNTAQAFSATVNRQFSKGSLTLSASQNYAFQELALLNRQTNRRTQVQYLPALSFQFSDPFWRSAGTSGARKTTLTGSLQGSLVRYYREEGYNGIGASATPQFNLRFPVFRHFNGSIRVAKNVSRYQVWDPAVPESQDDYGFQIWQGGSELNTAFSRIYTKDSGIFSRFKHLFTPRLQYDYIEDVPQISDSGVPFGGGISTRRLATLRLENTLLVKRRYFERSVKLTSRSSESIVPSRKARFNSKVRRTTREGKSWILARLNFIQHYDLLSEDSDFAPIGPAIKGNETEKGQPLLPLRTELTLTPGPAFSVNFFNRYHHQEHRVVEYSAGVSVGVSTYNKASVSFRNNEKSYQTLFGKDVAAANTFGFSNNYEANDELAFGFSGSVNLDPDSSTYRRRLASSAFNLDYRPDCWNIRMSLTENVAKTKTSGGQEEEYIDRTLFVYINLGGVALPEQKLPDLE